MIKYGKVIDELTGLCEIGTGTNVEFYKSIGFKKLDVKQSDIDNNWYLSEQCPIKTEDDREKEEKEKRIKEIKNELKELDLKTIRPIRANETELVYELEQRALELRLELNGLK